MKSTVPAENTVCVKINAEPEKQELLVALLAEIGFEAFEEKESSLEAFIPESLFNEDELTIMLSQFISGERIDFEVDVIEPKDWNEEWEKNFNGVTVGDFCEIHPPFKPETPGIRYHVQVMPKMAFGTGHHATTWMMIKFCEGLEFAGKKVLDMGCGTGVLGILALKMGAKKVTLIDIDNWSFENTNENIKLNAVLNAEVILGDAGSIPEGCYEIILANINRNVLLAERDVLVSHLSDGGILLLSGVLTEEINMVADHYKDAGLELLDQAQRNEWSSLKMVKKPAKD